MQPSLRRTSLSRKHKHKIGSHYPFIWRFQLVRFTSAKPVVICPYLCARIVVDAVSNNHITHVVEYLLCCRHCAERFASVLSLDLHSNTVSWVLSLFYRQGDESSEKGSVLPTVTQVVLNAFEPKSIRLQSLRAPSL